MTATLYHKTGEGWTRTELAEVWAKWVAAAAQDPAPGRDDAGESQVLIPWRAGIEIAPGDGILPGRGPAAQTGGLKAWLPEARVVTAVALHRPGSALDHWEVTAR